MALVFTVLLLVAGVSFLLIYSINQARISEKVQAQAEALSRLNTKFLTIDSVTGANGVVTIHITALKGPIDLNRIAVFVNHRYVGSCEDLNCSDQTHNGYLITGESGEINVPYGGPCTILVLLDYKGSTTEYSANLCVWHCRRTITITSFYDENDYPVRIELNSDNFDLNATNGNDLRFYDGNTKLSYWVESWNSTEGIVWVDVNVVNGEKNIYMYYCNPFASSESNGYAVFTWFNFDDSNLLAVFHFNEGSGTKAYSVVNGYSATLEGNTTWVTGYYSYGLSFDGNNDYATTDFNINTKNLTYLAIVKPEALRGADSNLGKIITDGAWDRAIGVGSYSSPDVAFFIQFDSNASNACYTDYYPSDVWYSIAGVVDASRNIQAIYVDGSLARECNITQGIPDRVQPTLFGIEENTTPYQYDYNGLLDEVILFGRVLSNEEINALSHGYFDYLNGVWVVRKRRDPEPSVTIGPEERGEWTLK